MGRESLAVVSSPPSATAPSTATAATSLAPGFRFHPTDEELVSYYLKRKVLGKPVRFDAIGEVDIYKHEPWDLAVFSKLKTRDQECGRAPDGLRTNWVMHEYRLVEYETETNGSLLQDAYVLCRVFHKNNIGPPSGNRYAPFMEEEWADGGGALIPGIDVRVRVEALPQANGNNQMDQEIHSTSKDLININELPRDATPMDIESNQQNHHESAFKPQENNNHSGYEEDEETLKREHAEEDERPPPLSMLNKEAPLPLLQYKRRRQNESNNNSSRSTQDHCSSTITTVDNTTTLTSSSSAAAATNTAISALLEFSLMGISEKKENQQQPLSPHKEASPPSPIASPEEKVNDLHKEIHQMSVERETFKLEMMSAEAMISILQSRIDALRQENEELKKKNASGQAS
ncbi:unnamed protein product [Arabidopsis arenosa]|uniref:NAC domain-containing protein n=1 Tax=Arabidopsis arenosa TaxID=38785 RepID=A0A8S1ZZX0_ARAAE|nr:unnamed protein product [Arabidopsis arenosa]